MNKTLSFEIPSGLDKIKDVITDILSLLTDTGVSESDRFDIRLCLEESLVNAIKYGNKFNEKAPVKVECSISGGSLKVSVEDKGEGFDYKSLPDPTKMSNILKTKGRGVFLIKHLMDKVEFSRHGSKITMTKYIKKDLPRTKKRPRL